MSHSDPVLRAALDAIWARYIRGELTIRQLNIEEANAANAALAPERERLEREHQANIAKWKASVVRGVETRRKRKEWREGVAKIMAEVRRREAARALPEPPIYTSDNPLDGERLWA